MLSINKYQTTQQTSFKGKEKKLSEAEKKAFRAMDDLEISRIMNDPRIPSLEKKYILQNKMIQRALDNGLLKTMKDAILKAIIKR